MKKAFLFLLCAVLCCTLCSCSGGTPDGSVTASTKADATAVPTATPEPAFEPLAWDTVPETPASDFTYEPSWNEDEIRITAYNGTDAIIKVPAVIEGKPVANLTEKLFRGNEIITHVYLPDSITYIGDSCFNSCASLVQLHLPASLTEIPKALCYECPALVQVDFPTALKTIREEAFDSCVSLQKAELPEITTYIESDSFDGCQRLTTFKAPGLKRLGQCALRGCESLTELVLHEGLTNFSGNALNGCTSLTSLTLTPATEADGDKLIFENGILYIVSDDEVPEYTAIRMLPGYPADAVQLHPNTTELEHSVFYGCQLRSIEIPAVVDKLPGNAFYNCEKLETVTFAPGSQLRLLEMNVFFGCSALTSIDLSFVTDTLTMYGGAFYNNDALTSVRLPANVNANDDAETMFRYSPNVVINYQGKDYTHAELSELNICGE